MTMTSESIRSAIAKLTSLRVVNLSGELGGCRPKTEI